MSDLAATNRSMHSLALAAKPIAQGDTQPVFSHLFELGHQSHRVSKFSGQEFLSVSEKFGEQFLLDLQQFLIMLEETVPSQQVLLLRVMKTTCLIPLRGRSCYS